MKIRKTFLVFIDNQDIIEWLTADLGVFHYSQSPKYVVEVKSTFCIFRRIQGLSQLVKQLISSIWIQHGKAHSTVYIVQF
jgi:hypothetical protein